MCPSARHVPPGSRPLAVVGVPALLLLLLLPQSAQVRMSACSHVVAALQERPPRRGGKGFAFRLCLLLSATLLLGLLQLGLRGRSGPGDDDAPVAEEQEHTRDHYSPSAAVAVGRGSSRGGRRTKDDDEALSSSSSTRRRVTYVRRRRSSSSSSRRATPAAAAAEPTCCPQGAPPRRKTIRWHIDLQPWAGPTPSLSDEALRLLKYISTAQISCDQMNVQVLTENSESTNRPWAICLDDRFSLVHQIKSQQCRLYSLGLGSDDNQFEISMANNGCEVHRFDPSIKSAHFKVRSHLWSHRLSIDWRDPNPAIAAHKLRTNTKKLGTVLNEFGHHKIDILKADMESAEWKILENLILEDIVEQIGQLVFAIHLHWPGFEVSGNDSAVVRYWYSLLKELERKDFKLFHTHKDLTKPQIFLKREAFNASSCYTLSWVNTKWKQRA